MLFYYLPRPIQRGIDLLFGVLLIVLAVAFLSATTPEKAGEAQQTMQLQHQAMEQTGLNCYRVILAEPGRIDCYDDSGHTVLSHTNANGWEAK